MIAKLAGLAVLGMGAQSYYGKTKKGKKEKEMAKKAAKKRMAKSKCKSCGGKGCSKCMSDTGDGTGAAQGKYGK